MTRNYNVKVDGYLQISNLLIAFDEIEIHVFDRTPSDLKTIAHYTLLGKGYPIVNFYNFHGKMIFHSKNTMLSYYMYAPNDGGR